MSEKKKPKNIDEVFDEFTQEHSKSISDAFKAHDKHQEDDVQFRYLHDMFIPGHQDLYQTAVTEIDKAFKEEKGDSTKIAQKHHGKIKKAVSEGLKKYFAKVQPSVLDAVKDMNPEEAYEHLVGTYDDHIGGGKIEGSKALRESIDDLLKGKGKIGDLKSLLYEIGPNNSAAARDIVNNKHLSQHLIPYQHRLHAHLRKELEKKGMEIKGEHQSDFYHLKMGDLLGLRKTYLEGKGHPYLKNKEKK